MGQSRRKVVVITGTAAAVAGPLVVGAGTADAAAFNVTNLNDSGAGSLRQAIADANSAGGADVITFQAGLSGTITLTSVHYSVAGSWEKPVVARLTPVRPDAPPRRRREEAADEAG